MTVRNDHHSDFEAGQLPLFSRQHLCFWSARGPSSPSVPRFGLCGVDNCAACNHSNKTMQCKKPCLLYPQKRTFAGPTVMSSKCH